jgi:prevent-host-death family protein
VSESRAGYADAVVRNVDQRPGERSAWNGRRRRPHRRGTARLPTSAPPLPALERFFELTKEKRASPAESDVDTSRRYDVYMADVGVRELKQRLSEYLDRAERGELVLVTERGRPKALLGPLPGRARIQDGVAEGWITPGSESGLPAVRRWKSPRRVLDVLADDRAE